MHTNTEVYTARIVSGWNYVFMGFACGVAVGMLLEPMLGFARPAIAEGNEPEKDDSDEPSTAKKILDKIPTRVKVKTVTGALKGGGGEAYHIAKKKMTGRR